MPQTEITVQIFEDVKSVKTKLQNLGYMETEEFTGNDYYFTTLPETDIQKATYADLLNSSVIVRSFKTKGAPDLQNSIVFKNKTLDEHGNVVSEEKISCKIDDYEKMVQILKMAKLNNWVSLSQQNAFYVKDEKCITVGTVKGLSGTFMEIEEFQSMKNLTSNEKIVALKSFANSLDLPLGTDYSIKKVFMLFNKNKENIKCK